MNKLVIRSGRLIDPANHIDAVTDIYIEQGKIAAIGAAPSDYGQATVLDAANKIVCPGLIDLCGRVGGKNQDQALIEMGAALKGGVTSICVPSQSPLVFDHIAAVQSLQALCQSSQSCRLWPSGALTLGLLGQQICAMSTLQQAGCVIFGNGYQPIENTHLLRRCFDYADNFNLTLSLYSEDGSFYIPGGVHEGSVSARLGLPGIPAIAETLAVQRYLCLVEETGVRAHFSRLSSAASLQLLAKAKQQSLAVSCDVAIHHLHLSEWDLLEFNAQCHNRPPFRSQADRAALRAALQDGTIDAICSDHQPLNTAEKFAPFEQTTPGISSIEILLSLSLSLVESGVLTLNQAIAALTANPAGILGLELGQLQPGAEADICIFDPKASQLLSADTWHSSGQNTPFMGQKLPGQVHYTLLQGQCRYQRASA